MANTAEEPAPAGAVRILGELDALIDRAKDCPVTVYVVWHAGHGWTWSRHVLDRTSYRLANKIFCESWSILPVARTIAGDIYIDHLNVGWSRRHQIGYIFTNYFHAWAYFHRQLKKAA